MNRTFAVATLGCKVNQYESSVMTGMFKNRGYQAVEFGQQADIYLINTCTVTHLSDRKSRQLIRRAVKTNPNALVIVTGCYAQTSPHEIMDIEGVNLVVGTADRDKIIDLAEKAQEGSTVVLNCVREFDQNINFEELPAQVVTSRKRAFLKIEEGCSNYCSYCIVPFARGPQRSRSFKDSLNQAINLVEAGFKEIVLTGIHLGSYGRDLGDEVNLNSLINTIIKIPGLARLRISSLEPMDITPDLINTIAAQKGICRHLHIPLQSGDDQVLEKMRRNYNINDYRRVIKQIRDRIPEIALTTDVMAGFPGETDQQFYSTCDVIKDISFSRLHVFKYSRRKGTPAAEFDNQIHPAVKEERSKILLAISNKMSRDYACLHLGTIQEVLVEGVYSKQSGYDEGLTDNYLRVLFPSVFNKRGEIVNVKIESLQGENLRGTII
ncbi:MAG TPA: tRNA (N(6)-L-threonylcarbamoyladenosine(37)-C(2))-methylthiotransferase MtaB [Desulfotomaculum sp.]|nr:tRNA (N(6)-L-threonylcarbamoyladenosine(37)-C(2))-methylthiotransferase MtaB [Desulfotomaculum sp.]HBY03379.1 tRNA (N(6)-L-threonylcarbamoyladenosine(37)-C(2))-methylthiotransferase MtaB [Desulfotomaculum sp.]